ncbi:hypothetical protein AFCDBAGC_4539 [Methylobacterium cerastii]|uniref:PH domain-containing protein n=1 Tax=Methylobacterium cerastii TaxID=932741 RepID=A0ABQ4QPL1_9HYPH|nr:hypothetical protein [Methylobacterium cerastii]GJD46656.1 hypothetical protein AFCDBAGC_4539 [Methylobacterium cerastii]
MPMFLYMPDDTAAENWLIALSRAHDLLEWGQCEGVELRDLMRLAALQASAFRS